MRTTRVTTLVAGPLVALGLVFGTAACGNPVQSTPTQQVPECDEDDWEEGDEDCEGLSGPNAVDDEDSTHKVKKSKSKKQKKSSFGGSSSRKSGGKRG